MKLNWIIVFCALYLAGCTMVVVMNGQVPVAKKTDIETDIGVRK